MPYSVRWTRGHLTPHSDVPRPFPSSFGKDTDTIILFFLRCCRWVQVLGKASGLDGDHHNYIGVSLSGPGLIYTALASENGLNGQWPTLAWIFYSWLILPEVEGNFTPFRHSNSFFRLDKAGRCQPWGATRRSLNIILPEGTEGPLFNTKNNTGWTTIAYFYKLIKCVGVFPKAIRDYPVSTCTRMSK